MVCNLLLTCFRLFRQGFLEYSFLFYGYYGNEKIQVGVVRYPLPLAYFVVFMGTYLFSIIIVLRAYVSLVFCLRGRRVHSDTGIADFS